MKTYIILTVIVLAVLGGIAFVPNKTEYIAPEVVVQEKEVEVDALEQAIKDAQEARKDDMETIAQKAYEAAYTQEMKKTELEVIESFNKKLDERQIQLEKDTKIY